MADYKEKFDEWQQAARRKARELDEKYSISDLVGEAAKRGAETVAGGAERLRNEAERLTDDEEISDAARRAANETVKNVTVASGATGVIRASRDASVAYANTRETFGTKIGNHQLVKQKIAEMEADYQMSHLLWLRAGWLKNERSEERR